MKISFLVFASFLIIGSQLLAQNKNENVDKSFTEVQFKFEKVNVKIYLRQVGSDSRIMFTSLQDKSGQKLKISTKQSSSEQVTEIPAVLVPNFRGLKTLKDDIRSLNIRESDMKQFKSGNPKQDKLANGVLYSWTIPSLGSADYYYLTNAKNKNLAFKLGPVPGIVAKDFKIDWSKTVWE